jgi:hypothetical protein
MGKEEEEEEEVFDVGSIERRSLMHWPRLA